MDNKRNIVDQILEHDIVLLHGSKVKLKIPVDQPISIKMLGINTKYKRIRFEFDDISKIIRGGKTIYSVIEE